MTKIAAANVHAVAERMGSEASTAEALQMVELLLEAGYTDTDEVEDKVWQEMLERAVTPTGMYELNDTFNKRLISRHRTLDAAVRADIAHGRAVRRANGQSSYIPTSITRGGRAVDREEIISAQQRVEGA